jgi:outer membrane protein OmpA-like peptidoglycan-associated protein
MIMRHSFSSTRSSLRQAVSMTTVRSIPLVAILALAACAPGMKPGMLSPVGARVTNEVLDADQHTFAAWSRRLAATGTSTASSPARVYTAARASAWLGLARDAYAADPRDSTADHALAEAGRLVLALESNSTVSVERSTAVAAGPRADLWAALDSLRNSGAAVGAPAELAEVEVTLVRVAYLSAAQPAAGNSLVRTVSTNEQVCDVQSLLTRAEQLLMGLRGNTGRTASIPSMVPLPATGIPAAPKYTVQLAGEEVPSKAPVPVRAAHVQPVAAAAPDTLPPMQLVVHFARMSSAITAESRVALDEVIAGLRAHRAARIVFEGYTGKRVGERFNRALAARRTAAVQRYLADAKLDLPRLTRASRRAATGTDGGDMRMMLSFIGADGRTLTLRGVHDTEPQTSAGPESHDGLVFTQVKAAGSDRSSTYPR